MPTSKFMFGRWISQGTMSRAWQYLVVVNLDYAMLGPFILVRYDLGGLDLRGS